MAIGKITGQMLNSNLERAGNNLAIDANLVYFDVNNRRVGISNTNPAYTLDLNGNAHLGNLYILGNTITSDTGKIGLGTVANVVVTGGHAYDILYTDGNGNLSFGNLNSLSGLDGFTGNNIILGTTSYGPDGFGTTAIDLTGSVTDAILILDDILGNITDATGSVIHVTGNISGGAIISPTIDAINANISAANVAISTLQANVGAFEQYANANIGTLSTHITTLDANVGAYETYANLQINNITANVGAFELYANANIGTIYTHLNTLDANVGAFELYANANIGTIYTHVNTLDANVGAYEIYSNANAAVQAISITSLATGANANTAAYLSTYTGNINAANFTGNLYGNIHTDIITPYKTSVTTFNSSTAIGLPLGGNVTRPGAPTAGQIRYNTDYNTVEFYNGTNWISVITEINEHNFFGDGINQTFTLPQVTTSAGILVSINGTVQQPGYAYDVTGNQITFTQVPLVTDQVDVRFLAVSVVRDNWFDSDVTITGNILPSANVTYNLGSPAQMWKALYVSGNTIYLGGAPLSIVNNVLTINGTPTYSDANVATYLASGVDSTLNSITTAWKANAATQDANIGGLTNNVTTLFSNAASQANSINTINANVTAANAAITAANVYNKSYTDTAVANLVNSAPAQLDTLNELSIALGNNASFSTTITGMIGNVQANITAANAVISTLATIASPGFTGLPTAPTANISVNNTQLATTAYVHNMFPTGIIMMWSGSSATIPYGWYLCDGNNGTPNLRDRFVVGAGNTYAVGATGGSADATLVSHTHTASSSTSTSISDPGHKHWASGASHTMTVTDQLLVQVIVRTTAYGQMPGVIQPMIEIPHMVVIYYLLQQVSLLAHQLLQPLMLLVVVQPTLTCRHIMHYATL